MNKANSYLKLINIQKDEDGVYRMQHYYRDNVSAIIGHVQNLTNTYGKKYVLSIIKNMIESGEFNDND